MNYSQQILLARTLTVLVGGIALIQASDADVLGLSTRMLAWLGIISGVIALSLGFLPSVRGADQQPAHIANRIMELTPTERAELIQDIEAKRAAEEVT